MPGPSRYDGTEIATVQVSDGADGERQVRYLLRRTPPDSAAASILALHRVAEDDRLDLISARYYGDAIAFWRICDVNAALDPDDLVASDAAGTVLVIPVPGI